MVTLRVTASGQISLPAGVRRRWGVGRVVALDEGDRVVLMPVPDDPVGAAIGSLPSAKLTAEDLRRRARGEEARAERRRARR